MDTQPEFGFRELFTHLLGDMAKAMSQRAGEPKERHFARTQAATHTILAFSPRDSIELMIAGHCVMFHEMIVDSVGDTLRGEADPAHRAARGTIAAMDKAFGNNLERLERYQRRRPEGQRDASVEAAAPTVGTTDIGTLAKAEVRPLETGDASAPGGEAAPRASHAPENGGAGDHADGSEPADWRERSSPNGAAPYVPTRETIAACGANPTAMAALNSGDAAGFARAMGVTVPNKGFLAAAAEEGSPFRPPEK
jgi:hypothetical protein